MCTGVSMLTLALSLLAVAGLPAAQADSPIQLTLSPAQPLVNEPVTMTFTGTSDTPEKLYVFIYDYVGYQASGGTICLGSDPTPRNSSEYLVVDVPVSGAFSVPATTTFPLDENYLNGDYTLCAWLADSRASPAMSPRRRIDFHVSKPPVTPPLPTSVAMTFRFDRRHRKLAVTSHILASGKVPEGSCVLEVQRAHVWLDATSHVAVDAGGRCHLSLRVKSSDRVHFRVRFRPATGFRTSVGHPAWLFIEPHM
jgi:hypothetical protein